MINEKNEAHWSIRVGLIIAVSFALYLLSFDVTIALTLAVLTILTYSEFKFRGILVILGVDVLLFLITNIL